MLGCERRAAASALALEARARAGEVEVAGTHELEGHAAAHRALARAVDDAHPAAAQAALQVEVAQALGEGALGRARRRLEQAQAPQRPDALAQRLGLLGVLGRELVEERLFVRAVAFQSFEESDDQVLEGRVHVPAATEAGPRWRTSLAVRPDCGGRPAPAARDPP